MLNGCVPFIDLNKENSKDFLVYTLAHYQLYYFYKKSSTVWKSSSSLTKSEESVNDDIVASESILVDVSLDEGIL